MLERTAIPALSVRGLVASGEVRPNLTDGRPSGTGAVPSSQALGLFRYVCLDDEPKSKLLFPFSQEEHNTFKHADFDLRFIVPDQTCTMIVKLKEATTDEGTGNRGNRTSTETVLEGLDRMSPKTRTQAREDGYVVATIPKN